ncbi:MAG: twin-arginine translocase subunit TatC [Thermoleophilia bacterium]|jgi:sec-independent protein translocase protein TatC|nr:twin-arginine translocase subunit TatC [Thermoleophilia bacterium]
MRFRLPLGVRRVEPDERLSVVEHLTELRRRLVVSLLALAVAFAAMYAVHGQLLDLLLDPLPERYRSLLALSPSEPFFTILKVVFGAAVLVSLPVWLYQLYAFVIPAVAVQTRRKMLAVVAGVSLLFAGGVVFGYFLVLPTALEWLLGFGDGSFNVQLRAAEYFGFALTMLLAAGLVFEVPVAMLALARMGLVPAAAFRKNRRFAVVIIAAVAAILPGGDPISMLLLMLPMLVLYEVGILLAGALGSTTLWDRETWQPPGDEANPTP